jgi:hypothetical protein
MAYHFRVDKYSYLIFIGHKKFCVHLHNFKNTSPMSIESERARLQAQRTGNIGSLNQLLEDNKKLIDENARLTAIIEGLLGTEPEPNQVRLILISNNTKSILRIMALSIAANQSDVGALSLLDEVTQQPVTATFANTTAVSDTPAAFTASVDANGNPNVVGVAAGAGNLTVQSQVTYTNSLGNQVVDQLSVVIPVTITAVVSADNVQLVVTFGPPTTQPPAPASV